MSDEKDHDNIEIDDDPHESKIDPADPRLKIPRAKGRTLKKGPVVAVVAVIGVLIIIVLGSALHKNTNNKTAANSAAKQKREEAQQVTIPAAIMNAPDNKSPLAKAVATASTPEDVPQLGEQLPGDLGMAMEDNARRKSAPVNYANSVKSGHYSNAQSTGRSTEKDDAEQAETSGLFFSGASGGGANNKTEKNEVDDASKAVQNVMGLMKNQAETSNQSGTPVSVSMSSESTSADQNMQSNKNAFVGDLRNKSTSLESIVDPVSPYMIMASTIIPASLITGINTDLPGSVFAQVRENVYDTATGRYLLIPQGSRLEGTYDSYVAYGQARALVVWTRLVFPDTSYIKLSGNGTDLEGYSGLHDKVNYHTVRILSGVVLSSLLSATVAKSEGSTTDITRMSYDQLFVQNAGSEINNVGQEITRKNINIQPTISIRPGFSFNVVVNKDLILRPFIQN